MLRRRPRRTAGGFVNQCHDDSQVGGRITLSIGRKPPVRSRSGDDDGDLSLLLSFLSRAKNTKSIGALSLMMAKATITVTCRLQFSMTGMGLARENGGDLGVSVAHQPHYL